MLGVLTGVLVISVVTVDVVNSVAAVVVVDLGVPGSTMFRAISLAVELLFLVELRSLEGVSNENIGVLDSLRAILNPRQKQRGAPNNSRDILRRH